MNIRKQLKVGKKMRGVTSSIRPRKLKGLRVARRIKAIRKMNIAKRLRRSLTRAAPATGTASTNTARMLPVIPTTNTTSTSGKWIAIVKKKISSSRPKFPYYYNNKGRNGSTNKTSKNNMIIIHNNTSITGNEELDNRTSCVDEGKDINPLKLKEDDDHVASVDSAAPLPPDLHQLASGKEDNKEDNNEEEEAEIIRLRGEEKAAIHIQSVFRGHLVCTNYNFSFLI